MRALFARPEWLLAVTGALAGVALAMALATARAARRGRRLLGARARPLLRRALQRDAMLMAALALTGIALLAPRFGERTERTLARGIDLVLLLDVSRSMDATDVPPSRLRRAREIAAGVLARLMTGDRAALAAFGDRGVLLTPLTPDADALLELLPALDADLVARRASSLADGVRAALGAFEAGSTRARVVLLLTDGEDPAGGARTDDALAAELRRSETRLVSVTLGDAAGATIPDHGIALRDDAGRVVKTRSNAARLDALAVASGGIRLESDRYGAIDLDAALAALRRDAGAAPGEWFERRVPAVHVLPFALLALLLLAAEARPLRAWLPPVRRLAALALLAGVAVPRALADAGAAPSAQRLADLEAVVRTRPGDADALLALGYARARAGLLSEAASALRAAALSSSDASRAALAFFDLGVLALESGELVEARSAFFEALARDPSDGEARFNLEWTLDQLARTTPPGTTAPAPDDVSTPDPSGAKPAVEAGAPADEADPSHERDSAAPRGDQSARADRGAPAEVTPERIDQAGSRDVDGPATRAPIALSADEARRLLDAVGEPHALRQQMLDESDATGSAKPRGVVW